LKAPIHHFALFEPVLPQCSNQNTEETLRQGDIPRLDELRLHQSTVWSWNRAVFDPDLGGHFRIECRSLPAGPSAIDMAANSALLMGLAAGLSDEMPYLIPAIPFALVEYNFYRAAQFGLDAKVLWPDRCRTSPVETNIIELLDRVIPIAEKGLTKLNVSSSEITIMLGNIQNRLDRRITGSLWQNQMITSLQQNHTQEESLHLMLNRYISEMQKGHSVADWDRFV